VGDAIPRLPNPLAAPDEAVGGPRDCRVSLAGCPGSVGVEGAGPGEGDRWGLRVWDAIFEDRRVRQRVGS
jgi:hypothetical protein